MLQSFRQDDCSATCIQIDNALNFAPSPAEISSIVDTLRSFVISKKSIPVADKFVYTRLALKLLEETDGTCFPGSSVARSHSSLLQMLADLSMQTKEYANAHTYIAKGLEVSNVFAIISSYCNNITQVELLG